MFSSIMRWIGIAGLMSVSVVPAFAAGDCPTLLRHDFTSLQDGKPMPLCQYAGKVILVVNTASYCGFTSQYDGLEKLYARLKDKGLVVLGWREVPINPDILEFPMVGKTVVKGKNANPFYVKLAAMSDSRPKWNFHKYLINHDGTKVVAYTSFTKPDDKDLLKQIDEFLAKKEGA